MQAGKLLRSEGFIFDRAYTSVLKRCIVSLHTVLEELEQLWIPEEKCWRLNERHYGGLQDQVKSEVAQKVGEKQAKDWETQLCLPTARYTDPFSFSFSYDVHMTAHATKGLCWI